MEGEGGFCEEEKEEVMCAGQQRWGSNLTAEGGEEGNGALRADGAAAQPIRTPEKRRGRHR